MLDRQISRTTRSQLGTGRRRFRKRRMLCLLIVTLGGSLAANSSLTAEQLTRPVVKTRHSARSVGEVRSNPFVHQRPAASSQPVQLMAGNEPTTLRLKPISVAVGLHSIDGPRMPKNVRPKLKVVDVPTTQVRSNQHLGSAHHPGRLLHDVGVQPPRVSRQPIATRANAGSEQAYFDAAPRFAEGALPQPNRVLPAAANDAETVQQAEPIAFSLSDQPAEAIASPSPSESPVPTTTASQPDGSSQREQSDQRLGALVETATEYSFGDQVQPAAETDSSVVSEAPAVVNHSNGLDSDETPSVRGEIADRNATAAEGALATASDAAEANENTPLDEPVVREAANDITEKPAVEIAEAFDFDTDVSEDSASEDESLPAVVSAEGLDTGVENPIFDSLTKPAPSEAVAESDQKSRGSEYPTSPKRSNEAIADQLRSPVAVAAPPASLQSVAAGDDQSVVKSAVHPRTSAKRPTRQQTLHWDGQTIPASARLAPAGPQHAPKREAASDHVAQHSLTPLYLSRAQVRSLTIRGQLRKVSVDDRSVCQAVAAGSSQIKLIGTGKGQTRLVVWATAAGGQKVASREFAVHVTDSVEASTDPASEKMSVLSQSIHQAFPNSDVTIQLLTDQIVVSGSCYSEDSAKRIIRMVRKTCLVPVRDELVVR